MSLSVILITKNEERNIRECLETLKFTDEIVLVDSGSLDKTLDIAGQCGAKVHTRPFDNFSNQKNFALAQAKKEWVLSVDADERVTPELAQEILRTIQNPSGPSAFRIPRQTFFLKKRFRFSGTQSDRPVRLFRREGARFEQPIHEFVAVRGEVGDLKNVLLHHTTPSVEQEKQKTEFYTDLEAKFLKEKKVSPSRAKVRLITAATFLHRYFWKLGILDGREGFLFAYFSSRYARCKYQKLRELYEAEDLEPRIQERFDAHAGYLPDHIDRSDRRLQALISACGALQGKKVLDVGCGKGRFAKALIEQGAVLTGIDSSPVLLREAVRSGMGVFLEASATKLPFEEETFDVVYAVEVIEHLPFLKKSLHEMLRVVKKGGRLVLIDRNKFSLNQRRFLVPNDMIKRWHEIKNHWIYPKGFPFRERWFSKRQVLNILKPYCREIEASYVLSDGEARCAWRRVFECVPAFRLFILWKGIKK